MLTLDETKAMLPGSLRGSVDQSFVDRVNLAATDPVEADLIKETFISYAHVLKEGKYKMEDYLSAVKYVSYKQMGLSNQDSYAKTFPQRWVAIQAKGNDPSPYVAAYHKNKLVNAVLEQSLVPMWLLNQGAYQQAINTQLDIMKNSSSDVARTQAANSVLTHLKRPEAAKVEIDVGLKVDGMAELRDLMTQAAQQQLNAISSGSATAGSMARVPVVIDHGQ